MRLAIDPQKLPYVNDVTHRAYFNDDPRFPGKVVELGLSFYVYADEAWSPSSDGRSAGHVMVRDVRMSAVDNSGVGALDVRSIPVAQLVREIIAYITSISGPDEELRRVAETHRGATSSGDDPLAAVAHMLKVGRTTAATRVREARAAGYLAPRDRKTIKRAFDGSTGEKVAPRVATPSEAGRSGPKSPGQRTDKTAAQA